MVKITTLMIICLAFCFSSRAKMYNPGTLELFFKGIQQNYPVLKRLMNPEQKDRLKRIYELKELMKHPISWKKRFWCSNKKYLFAGAYLL